MCGRFCIAASPGELSERYEATIPVSYTPRFNIAPSEPVLFITSATTGHAASIGAFGFSAGLKNRIINARTETVLEKPFFKTIQLTGRCLVPASGYYEWQQNAGEKIPFYISQPDNPIISFAGIFRTVQNRNECVILTTGSEESLKFIHPRMPLVLSSRGEQEYLSGKNPSEVEQSGQSGFQVHQVSKLVNKPGFESPDLIKPVRPQYIQQTLLI